MAKVKVCVVATIKTTIEIEVEDGETVKDAAEDEMDGWLMQADFGGHVVRVESVTPVDPAQPPLWVRHG